MITKLIEFLRAKKKTLLIPMLFALILFSLIAILSQGEIVPFLYKIF